MGEIKYNALAPLFTDIADAIRAKKGTTNKIDAVDFPEEISSITGGGATADYEQLVNYTMLYDEGDECVDVTGGWGLDGWSSGTANGKGITLGTKNSNNLQVGFTGSLMGAFGTNNAIDFTPYILHGAVCDMLSIYNSGSAIYGTAQDVINSKKIDSSARFSHLSFSTVGKYMEFKDVSNVMGNCYIEVHANQNTQIVGKFYNIFLAKQDDYTTLCTKAGITSIPSSLSELISNTTALSVIFANEDAMNFMAKQCTGDLMVSILNDATARGMLKSSPYLPYVVGNEHWCKFIMMIPEADELLNVTMLYDGSLGESGLSGANTCPDVTGGFVKNTISDDSSSDYNCDFNQDNIYLRSNKAARQSTRSNNLIELSGYTKLFARFDYSNSSNDLTYLRLGLHTNKTVGASNHVNNPDIPSIVYGTKASSNDGVVSGENVKIFDITDDSASMYFGIAVTSGSSMTTTANVYGASLLKPDNYSTLCNKIGILPPDSLEALLADSSAMSMLMNNHKAIDYLVGCTGDLMIGILQSEAAVASASEHAKKVLYGHPIWRKFIDMLGVDLIPAPDEYEQIVNYTMLYDAGDECEEVTGGWESNKLVLTSGWTAGTVTFDNSHVKLSKASGEKKSATITTKNVIDLSPYNSVVFKTFDGSFGTYCSARIYLNTLGDDYCSSGVRLYETNERVTSPVISTADISAYKESKMFSLIVTDNGSGGSGSATLSLSNMLLTKPDDWQTLCTKAKVTAPSDLSTLIADTTSLSTIFSNEDAVRFMVAQCTGDFMVSVLNDSSALEALKASPYLNIVVANTHWAKFAMMIPNAKSIFGFTMLYDEGDECTDVTGGLEKCGLNRGTATLTKNADNMVLSVSGSGNRTVTILTQNTFDFVNEYVGFGGIATTSKSTTNDNCTHNITSTTDKTTISTGNLVNYAGMRVSTTDTKTMFYKVLTEEEKYNRYVGFSVDNWGNDYSITLTAYNLFVFKGDDYQSLCSIAGIVAPTDIETLVADSTAMATIMSNEEAVKYLMGCTGDLMVSICNSEVAMGALVNNIAYDYAFEHPVWYKFMTMCPVSLAAMDSVAVTVPTMTSDTTPSGVARSSRGTVDTAFRAFDGYNDKPCVSANGAAPPQWVEYEFDELIELYKISLYQGIDNATGTNYSTVSTGYVSVSSDGINYETVYNFNSLAVDSYNEFILDSKYECKIVRITLTAFNNTYDQKTCRIYEAQFYGKAVVE